MVLIGSQAAIDRLKRHAKTIDDQIAQLTPLTPGTIAKLAGYARVESLSVKRHRGAKLTADQLRRIAAGLRSVAGVAENMAKYEERYGPGALQQILAGMATDLGAMSRGSDTAAMAEERKARPLRQAVSAVKAADRRAKAADKRRQKAANTEAVAELQTIIAARPPRKSPWGSS